MTHPKLAPQLGAVPVADGVSFAVWSQTATSAEVCLFRSTFDGAEYSRIPLDASSDGVWSVVVRGIGAGQLYGIRFDGPWSPGDGHRCNPRKLVIDPYAKAIVPSIRWDDALFGYNSDLADRGLTRCIRDSASFAPKCVVVDGSFDWRGDRPPRTPWDRTVLYEAHVKGLTKLHPRVSERERGTYLGLASPTVIDHLHSLGVTAVELLPVQQSFTRPGLAKLGLTDYWGYNTIGFFAPDARFASDSVGEQVVEFKAMVRELHRAGIEVILDVVYNHTGEGDEFGPTIAFRGIDNAAYYRLDPHDRSKYENFAGCGNCLNVLHPRGLQLVMDSLRYWVEQMHVDGFRFDLATVLARDRSGVDPDNRFFATIQQDPLLSQVKLIAEPWDSGVGGYRVGTLPPEWSEWNDKYRDGVRRFWRGDAGLAPELARRISGSEDLFGAPGRTTHASINFIACHDGFTLRDVVSYDRKHNEDNGEQNRDGTDQNFSCNWGAEGSTDDASINELRACMQRNMIATLAFSLGVPMIQAGDELGRTQGGNNNAYCHDDERTWVRWEGEGVQDDLLAFARWAFALRSRASVFRRAAFFEGARQGEGVEDVVWLTERGERFTTEDWHDDGRKVVGMLVHEGGGDRSHEATEPRSHEGGMRFYLLVFNAGEGTCSFRLPRRPTARNVIRLLDTSFVEQDPVPVYGNQVEVKGRSMVLVELAE